MSHQLNLRSESMLQNKIDFLPLEKLSLNPKEFVYGTPNKDYLSGDGRAFVDEQSMVSITDDRSHLFLYAITQGNEEVFQSEIMQAKLLMLCQGIRDAWRWEKKTDIYPWEQCLKESIAYQK